MTAPAANSDAHRLRYHPAVDGLRAIAIAAVLVYHGDLGILPGGFLGVELFFVISGFLITSLLLNEHQTTGRIALGSFWRRRARRLLPSLFVMLGVTATFFAYFRPADMARVRTEVLASLGYVQNWYLIRHEASYFDGFERPSPFEHLWSLAIEEQFYVVWPLAVLGVLFAVRRRVEVAALVCLVGATASTLLMMAMTPDQGDPSRAYLGTDTRASGLLLGAALAFIINTTWLQHRIRHHAIFRSAAPSACAFLGLVGLGVLAQLASASSTTVFQGGFFVFGAASAMVIGAVVTRPDSRAARTLGRRWLVGVGKRSYAAYLWYWPVFVLTRPREDLGMSSLNAFAIRIAIVMLLSELTYRLIETPIRAGALGRIGARIRRATISPQPLPYPTVGALAAVVIILFGATSVAAQAISATPPPPPFTETALRVGFDEPSSTSTTVAPDINLIAATPTVPAAAVPTETATPAAWTPPAPPAGRVVAVGDSVLLGAAPALQRTFPGIGIDAQVGRQPWDVPAVWAAIRADGTPIDVAIVAVGNNGALSASAYTQTMAVLADVPNVVWVTPAAPLPWADQATALLRSEGPLWGSVRVADWAGTWPNCPAGSFLDDYVHLTAQGADCYANTILVSSTSVS